MRRLRPSAAAAAILAAVALGACGSSPAPSSTAAAATGAAVAGTGARSHVVLLLLENEERGSVIGSSDAPYLNSLVRHYGTATNSYAIRHPSLPNYLALVSGSTQGVTSDCNDCRASGPNLADQLDAAGLSWKDYAEGLPKGCFRGIVAGRYAKRHDPFAYWRSITGNPKRCRHRVSFKVLHADLRAHRLPAFSLVVPDVCHDMHDCGVATGDRFLSRLVPRIVRALGPSGYLVITFDEGTTNADCCNGTARGGRIPTIVVGPGIAPAETDDSPVDHYGILGTIEDTFALPRLGAAKDQLHGSLRGLFRALPRIRR